MSTAEELDVDRREQLKPYKGKAIVVEARLKRFGTYFDYDAHRRVPSALIEDVDLVEEEKAGEKKWPLLSYCWVGYADPIERAGAKSGDRIRFEVRVYSYETPDPGDHNRRIRRYAMRSPTGVEIVERFSSLNGVRPDVRGAFPPVEAIVREALPPPGAAVMKAPAPVPEPAPPQAPVAAPPPPPDHSAKECLSAMMEMFETFGAAKVAKAYKAAKSMFDE
jgi:hypothetical protein